MFKTDPLESVNINVKSSPSESCLMCGVFTKVFMGEISLFKHALPHDVNRTRRLWKCKACGTVTVDPLPTQNQLMLYYQSYAQKKDIPQDVNIQKEWADRPIIKTLLALTDQINPGNVLDIGCGDGGMLHLLPQEWKKFGVDISEEACTQARNRGIHAVCAPFLSAQFPYPFQWVIALDVLEHFPNPHEILQRMVELLEPGGLVVIQTGNADCLVARTLKVDWSYTAIFGHLFVTTPNALRNTMADLGVEEVELKLDWHKTAPFFTKYFRKMLSYGFHTFRLIYDLLNGWPGKIPTLKKLYLRSPPEVLHQDHFTFIGRKIDKRSNL